MLRKPLTSERIRDVLDPIRNEISDAEHEELRSAIAYFIEVFSRLDEQKAASSGIPLAAREITELGEYGTGLLMNVINLLGRQGKQSLHRVELMSLTIDLALWICRNEGEIVTLEPVVDALAYFANNSTDTGYLEGLHGIAGEILRGTTHQIREDLDRSNPARPWRILNLNKAIVATRTHNAELIEQAYQELVGNLPEDAPDFFQEGMEQMDALDYPPHVRKVVERYYQRWNVRQSLH